MTVALDRDAVVSLLSRRLVGVNAADDAANALTAVQRSVNTRPGSIEAHCVLDDNDARSARDCVSELS
jgi:hypothetical protein